MCYTVVSYIRSARQKDVHHIIPVLCGSIPVGQWPYLPTHHYYYLTPNVDPMCIPITLLARTLPNAFVVPFVPCVPPFVSAQLCHVLVLHMSPSTPFIAIRVPFT